MDYDVMLKKIAILMLSLSANVFAGTYYYKGGSFFVTALNEKLLSDEKVEAYFAVRPPAMMCGVYGVRKSEIQNFGQELRLASKEFLKPETGPALAVFFSTQRLKLFKDYPDIKDPHGHAAEKLPEIVKLGDDPEESYEFGILTWKGFFVYKDGKFAQSYLKDHKGYLSGLLFYIEYLQDLSKPFYLARWGCQNYK